MVVWIFQSSGSPEDREKSPSDAAAVTQPDAAAAAAAADDDDDDDADAANEEAGSSKSSSVPSFHAPVSDVEGVTSAERLEAERMQDNIDERNFELGQQLKKSVVK